MGSEDPARRTRATAEVPGSAPEPEPVAGSFESFYRDELVRLLRFLRSLGASWEGAWDISQECFLTAMQCWGTLSDPPKWIRTTSAREYRRTQARRADELNRMLRGGWEPRPHFDKLSIAAEEAKALMAIASLPPRQAEVMALTYDGYTPVEIAEILGDVYPGDNGITGDAVRASLYQARHKLKRLLAGIKEA